MAEIKWIKITTDIFDDEKILLIESMPEADSVIVIWFKLLAFAGKSNNNGVFMLSDKIAYTDEMLATIFRRPLNTVRMALQTFETFGMIEINDGVISIANWDKHQNVEGMDKIREQNRIRVAKHREKQKLLANIETCQYCGGTATGLDHIIPIAHGGTNDDYNLVPCCIDCNRKKNDKPLSHFLNTHRNIINDDIVTANEKLKKFVTLSNVTGRYEETLRNAIDKDKEEDKEEDKEKIKDKEKKRNAAYSDIISYLNEKAGTKFRATSKATQTHINARLAEGFTVDDFKTVIDKKCMQWLNDAKMCEYLRPETLFGTKFEGYLKAPTAQPKSNSTNFNSYGERTEVVNGKEYIYKNGKYYIPGGSGIAVDPFKDDDLPF